MEIVDTDPDDYIAGLGDDAIRAAMLQLDATITSALPTRGRVLWQGTFWGGTDQTIIGYGHISQTRPSGDSVEWFLAGLARQKRNYSIYLNATRDGMYLAHQYANRLGKAKLGAASIGFTKPEHLNHDALTELLIEADRLTPPDPNDRT